MDPIPTFRTIAHIRTDFQDRYGIPRQAGYVPELRGQIEFEPEFHNPKAFLDIDDITHLWLIWLISKNIDEPWHPSVQPPHLNGEERGIFATRAPFRPNPIGLTVVELISCDVDPERGPILTVGGADLLDGTPILDIKPYHPADALPHSTPPAPRPRTRLTVVVPPELESRVPANKRAALRGVLAENPRPHGTHPSGSRTPLIFAGLEVSFKVDGETATVTAIESAHEK